MNGSKGKVVQVYMPSDEDISNGAVECIIVDVEDYKGSVLVTTKYGEGLPIFRVPKSEMDNETQTHSTEKVYPLDLAFSFTLHKIQGREYPTLAFYLGSREMCHNLDYTAFSRVRDMSSIMILDHAISPERFLRRNDHQSELRALQNGEEERLRELERRFLQGL